jgi:hypothetical protein
MKLQMPPLQTGTAPSPSLAQAVVQLPQWLGSTFVFTQIDPHLVSGGLQSIGTSFVITSFFDASAVPPSSSSRRMPPHAAVDQANATTKRSAFIGR